MKFIFVFTLIIASTFCKIDPSPNVVVREYERGIPTSALFISDVLIVTLDSPESVSTNIFDSLYTRVCLQDAFTLDPIFNITIQQVCTSTLLALPSNNGGFLHICTPDYNNGRAESYNISIFEYMITGNEFSLVREVNQTLGDEPGYIILPEEAQLDNNHELFMVNTSGDHSLVAFNVQSFTFRVVQANMKEENKIIGEFSIDAVALTQSGDVAIAVNAGQSSIVLINAMDGISESYEQFLNNTIQTIGVLPDSDSLGYVITSDQAIGYPAYISTFDFNTLQIVSKALLPNNISNAVVTSAYDSLYIAGAASFSQPSICEVDFTSAGLNTNIKSVIEVDNYVTIAAGSSVLLVTQLYGASIGANQFIGYATYPLD